MGSRSVRASLTVRTSLVVVGVIASLALPSVALGVFPGENGKIVFVSGRNEANDQGADAYILSGPGGSVTPLDTRAGQHRHPAWGPGLKRVAYALWDGANNEKIWVHVLATGQVDRLGPHASNVRDDRPAWSPDGKRIAYESEVTDGSGQLDILVADVSEEVTGAPVINLTQSPDRIDGKPAWSPDGKWIYYSRRPTGGSTDDDIWRRPSGGGDPEIVAISATAELQPSISPDGKRMCYTRGNYGSTDADIYVLEIGVEDVGYDLSDNTDGSYNCAWSPDGKYITYVRGVFANGALYYELADDSGSPQLLTSDTASRFDGNPDWAPLRPPFCKGTPATMAGTGGPDTIIGTAKRDVIAAFGGGDVVKSGRGNDLVCGGDGNDRLSGGRGGDTLYGDKGNDRLDGDAGTDTCVGGKGTDVLIEC